MDDRPVSVGASPLLFRFGWGGELIEWNVVAWWTGLAGMIAVPFVAGAVHRSERVRVACTIVGLPGLLLVGYAALTGLVLLAG